MATPPRRQLPWVTILGIVVQLLGSLLTITVAPSTPTVRAIDDTVGERSLQRLGGPFRTRQWPLDAEPTERPTDLVGR